ncbi:MAG TPA: VOC family protein [Acidimicrobiales bacterium]|nr:VOC family protein [Acidimicrobiales bacterium]
MRRSVTTTPPVPDPPRKSGVAHRWAVVLGWRYLPEPKTAKNRMHVDLEADDREKEITRLLELGATRGADHDEYGVAWTVMADPEGNEFCIAGP